MRNSRLLALLSLCALVFIQPASATSSTDKNLPPLPLPLKNMVDEGAQIRYLGKENGLDGWVTMKQGQQQYFYVTPDQQSIMMGILFNAKGDVVTLRQINQLRQKEGPAIDRLAGFADTPASAPKTEAPDLSDPKQLAEAAAPKSKSEQLYEAVSSANWIRAGKEDAPVIYSFIDPECPHCHDLINDIRKSGLLEQGAVQMRLIPVGLISETSLAEAAYLLVAPDPQVALFKHLDGDEKALLVDPGANTQGVQRNMALMQDWKVDVTPFSVYKDKTGKVKIIRGRPNDLKKIVAELR